MQQLEQQPADELAERMASAFDVLTMTIYEAKAADARALGPAATVEQTLEARSLSGYWWRQVDYMRARIRDLRQLEAERQRLRRMQGAA